MCWLASVIDVNEIVFGTGMLFFFFFSLLSCEDQQHPDRAVRTSRIKLHNRTRLYGCFYNLHFLHVIDFR